jgi:hypothetical protein
MTDEAGIIELTEPVIRFGKRCVARPSGRGYQYTSFSTA